MYPPGPITAIKVLQYIFFPTIHLFPTRMSYFTALTADPSLGRFDISSLSQQQLMEMLIENIDKSGVVEGYNFDDDYMTCIWTALPNGTYTGTWTGEFRDVCGWPCVQCECGPMSNVIEVEFSRSFTGEINLLYLPQTVEIFRLSGDGATGPLNTAALPRPLEEFSIPCNDFSGEVNFCTLPPHLRSFDISDNALTGSADLTALPKTLEGLDIQGNGFRGSVDLTQLPESLLSLYLSNCEFSGSVRLDKLPNALRNLFLDKNDFSGEISLENLPDTLEDLALQKNAFCGEFIVKTAPLKLVNLNVARNQLSGTAIVCRIAKTAVKMKKNAITAVVDEADKPYACMKDEMGHVERILE